MIPNWSGCVGVAAREQDRGGRTERLEEHGPSIGIVPEPTYCRQDCSLSFPSRLYLFSDGAYEIRKADGSMLSFEEFLDVMIRPVAPENRNWTAF